MALDQVRRRLGMRCRAFTTTERDIRKALDRLGQAKATISGTIVEIIQQAPLEAAGGDATLQETDDAPTIHLVNQLIGQAVELGASDVHFEPTESALLVRMRIDGILHQEHWLPKLAQSATLTRLKILAMMDVTETRVPQDGRVSVEVDHRRINLRVSSLPTQHGESIVLRILDANDAVQGMADLGLDAPFKAQLLDVMDAPHGVVIVTGPTGSGKTTTLYAMLKHLNNPDVSIFTLEDPVEIPVAGIRQTQVREEVGLTFGASLRSLLRQDPDIILVGETRDRETAELMIRAALTGHLVFTTLHTNDAPGAIPRLIDMGVEPYLLPSSLVAVLAQRLVRRLCKNCRRPVDDTRSLLAGLNVRTPEVDGATLWDAAGCPACHQAGYRGRQAIFEMMRLDESFHSLIIQRSAHSEFRRLARSTGMRTMFEDGLRHALGGTTSLRELLRVARPD
jgi:type II secretory ATPase GspE/PulE/Tfp pilus assembly ATPase PilB-like protein